jgi:hypothetical protein
VEKARDIVSKGLPTFDYAIPFWWNDLPPEKKEDWDGYVDEIKNRHPDELQSYWNDAPEDIFRRWGVGEPEKPGADVVSGKNGRAATEFFAATAATIVGILGRYELAHKSDDREKTIVVYNCFQKKNFITEMRCYALPTNVLSNEVLTKAGFAIRNLRMWNSPSFWNDKACVAMVRKAYDSLLKDNPDLLSSNKLNSNAGDNGFFGLFYRWSTIDTFARSTKKKVLEIDPDGSSKKGRILSAVARIRIRFLCREFELAESYLETEENGGSDAETWTTEITEALRDHASKMLFSGSGLPATHEFVPFFWNEDFPGPASALEGYAEEIEGRSIGEIQEYWNQPEAVFLGENART